MSDQGEQQGEVQQKIDSVQIEKAEESPPSEEQVVQETIEEVGVSPEFFEEKHIPGSGIHLGVE